MTNFSKIYDQAMSGINKKEILIFEEVCKELFPEYKD